MENENSISFSASKWAAQRKKKTHTPERIIIIFWLEQICVPCDSGSARPRWHGWMCWWKYFLSYMDKRSNEACYLFPAQQLHSGLVTLIPRCFDYASACAPAHTNTHRNILSKRRFTVKRANDDRDWNLLRRCFTSLSLDSFCVLPGGAGRSLYPEDLNAPSLGLSENVSSAVGGKLGAPFLELRLPTASQETALISGGKAPIVLISAVQGACWVGGRGTGLATPVAGAWLEFWPEPAPSSGLLGRAGSQFSFWTAKRGVRVPEETFLFSMGFQSTSSRPWGQQDDDYC